MTMTVDTDRLVTVRHFADMMGVTTTSVYAWMAQGKAKGIRIDGVTFVIVDNDSINDK